MKRNFFTVRGWRSRLLLLIILVLALSLPSAEAQAQKKKRKGKKKSTEIEMNFRNVDLVNFLSTMSAALGVAFIWDEKDLKGKITLISPRKFKRKDAFRIFETVLRLHGYTTIKQKGSPVTQIVPIKDASRIPSPTRIIPKEGEGGNVFLTQIIPLKFADANLIKAALTPLISKSAALAIYSPANVILLTDTEENIRRILDVVKELDVASGEVEFRVVRLEFASARKLAPILTSLVAPQGRRQARGKKGKPAAVRGLVGKAKVVAEEHTNSLIIVADKFTQGQLQKLIDALDIPTAVSGTGIKVYRLQHADAEDLKKILVDVKRSVSRKGKAKGAAGASGRLPEAVISADKATNSLIVFGPAEVIETMDELVRQLDIRRPQVFVEALIMEMTLEKSLQLGVTWQGTAQLGNSIVGVGTPSATPQTLAQTLGAGTGAVVGVVGNEIEFQGQKFASFSAFIQATRHDQDLNILANPQILTLNNEKAEINVSQVVPISSRILRDANQNITTDFEFKDIGIILSITPQITGRNKVRLIIDLESSSVASRQAGASDQQAITTLKRVLKTKVLVDNDSTIAIGGLIQDQQVENITKVPCLGDIPVLGWFFKSRTEEVRKTNLIIFIRPRIISTQEELEQVSSDVGAKYEETRGIFGDTEETLRRDFGLPPRQLEGEEEAEEPDEEREEGQESTQPAN